jgi:hypothetical protein
MIAIAHLAFVELSQGKRGAKQMAVIKFFSLGSCRQTTRDVSEGSAKSTIAWDRKRFKP